MFLGMLGTDGVGVSERERGAYAGRLRGLSGQEVAVVTSGPFVGLAVPATVPHRPLTARRPGLVAVGNVRLDNRKVVESWTTAPAPGASDLELVCDAYRARGIACVPDLLGDFAFAIYDQRSHTLIAARDAFGVKSLFSGNRPQLSLWSSHLEPVHEREEVDEEFVADFLLAGDPGPERTIWADARAVPPGSVLAVRDSKAVTNRFWTPHAFEPSEWAGEEEQADVFRALFSEAVRSRLDPDSPNWAELSGGLDSSSVVSMAQTLVENGAVREGVAGTVTLADELGAGDERRFSNVVVQRYGLRNEVIWNPWPWQDGGCPPPRLDEPRAHYPYFLRDELECALLHREGARVLLSGNGSDHYLYGNRYFVSDLAARGQLRCAMRELVRWSIADRQSVWKGLWRHLVLPLAPVALNRACAPPYDSVPPWIDRRFRQRTAIGGRLALSRTLSARRGTRFAREVANELQELTRWLQRGPFENGLELRYPFLYRPLVELGLSLPVSMRAQPRAPKWLLRQAMRGILPDAIRTRSGKGGIDARILWAMSRERARLTDIVRRSHLAELGLVSREHLWKAVEQAWLGQAPSLVMLLAVLGLETWFYVRSGRWTVDERSVA